MRGSPLIRAVIIIAVLLLAAIPLWKLTHRAEATTAATTAAVHASAETPVHIEITFAQPAESFQVLHLGKVIWEGRQAGSVAQKDFTMEFPKEGIDLELKVEWTPGTPKTAVRVAVTHGYGSTDKTAWGKGTLDEVLTFTDPQ